MPAVLLTTSSVIDEVARYARPVRAAPRARAPIVVAVDSLDLDSPREFDATRYAHPSTACLQYTSGRCSPPGGLRACGSSGDRVAILASQGLHWSTREPAGVGVSHKNVIANCAQMMCGYFEDPEGVAVSSVSWLPFYHDMGLMQGVLMPTVN
jgi:4-hydroxyphenylalkanoate adenylyltransferase